MERALTWILCLALLFQPGLAVLRIMALGDSITGSPVRSALLVFNTSPLITYRFKGCWRALLWQKLQTANLAQKVKFVGTLPGQGCGFPYDGNNEGHGGILATNLAREGQLSKWLRASQPDIMITHLGTNDVVC